MQINVKCSVVSATNFDFINDQGERVAGTKVTIQERSVDPNKCKGMTLTTYNAPFELYSQLPPDLPKELTLKLNMDGKRVRVDGLS